MVFTTANYPSKSFLIEGHKMSQATVVPTFATQTDTQMAPRFVNPIRVENWEFHHPMGLGSLKTAVAAGIWRRQPIPPGA